jgi:hypothetical protein
MSFFSKIEAEFKKLFGKLPSWDVTASRVITVIAPILETALVLIDPAAEEAVAPIITDAQADLATASVVISDAGPAPSLQTALASFTANLTAIETAAGIKDPATQTKFSAAVTVINGEVQAILAAIPATA